MFVRQMILCDDRPHKYDLLITEMFENASNIKLDYVGSVDELIGKLGNPSQRYEAVFLDLYYPGEFGHDKIISVDDVALVKKACGHARLILYTAFRDDATHDLLVNVSVRRLMDGWIDAKEIQEDPIKARIRINDTLDICDTLVRDNGLWILHLSDLHFGNTVPVLGKQVDGKMIADNIISELRLLTSHNSPVDIKMPHAVVLSGDGTFKGLPLEFDELETCMARIEEALREAHTPLYEPWFAIPGNHDLNWDLSIVETHAVLPKGESRQVQSRKQRSPSIFESVKWLNFDNAMLPRWKASGIVNSGNKWLIRDLRERLGMVLIGYNTCQEMNYQNNTPKISATDLNEIIEELGEVPSCSIFVLHHSMQETVPDERERQQILDLLYRNLGVRLILRGHNHRGSYQPYHIEGGGTVIELGVASTAVGTHHRAPDTLPGFQILQMIDPLDGMFRAVRIFSCDFANAKYRISPISGGGYFEEIPFS